MGTAALLHPLLSLRTPSPRFPNPRLALSSRSSSCFSVSAASPSAFASATIRRSRESALVIARASSEEEAAVGDLEAAPEEEDAPQDDAEEENPAASEAAAVEKPPRKPRIKFGDVIGILNKRAIEARDAERPVPDLRTGDIVELKWATARRRRPKVIKGIIISKQNAGIHTTIRIRKYTLGSPIEITFPVYSPNLREIVVEKHRKVRRAKLYYLKNKPPRFSTFKK